jgi:hypothetical protein
MLVALGLPLSAILIESALTPATWIADFLIAILAGFLSIRSWPEDHLKLWLASSTSARWKAVVGVRPPRSAADASRWMAESPERQDEWTVSALIASGQAGAARQLLLHLKPPVDDWQAFFRLATTGLLDLYDGGAVNIEAVEAAAAAIRDPDARLRADAQVANLGLNLALRGDVARADAVRRVKSLAPALRLTGLQRLHLWVVHFPGVPMLLVAFTVWMTVLLAGGSLTTMH